MTGLPAGARGGYPHEYGPRGEGHRRPAIPYTGPDLTGIRTGDPVQCRDRRGTWRPKTAAGPARYDHTETGRAPVRLSVPVADPAEWAAGPGKAAIVNWDADAVRPA
jgi:hypothetical protein